METNWNGTFDIKIMINKFLPIDESVPASNIETREVVKILTGNKIHSHKIGNTLTVSQELYDNLLNLKINND